MLSEYLMYVTYFMYKYVNIILFKGEKKDNVCKGKNAYMIDFIEMTGLKGKLFISGSILMFISWK